MKSIYYVFQLKCLLVLNIPTAVCDSREPGGQEHRERIGEDLERIPAHPLLTPTTPEQGHIHTLGLKQENGIYFTLLCPLRS